MRRPAVYFRIALVFVEKIPGKFVRVGLSVIPHHPRFNSTSHSSQYEMSATVEPTTSSWRKRSRDADTSLPLMEAKKPRRYYYRLESESSKASEEDTESVHSYQDRETDVVRDTSDSNSYSSEENEVEYEIEYEVASLSEGEDGNDTQSITSSGSEDMILAAAAAAICNSSIEWITDCEDSDSSSLGDSMLFRGEFSTCAQCKSQNINPLYRYCEKCYQSCRQCKMRKTYKGFPLCVSCFKDRKKFFPPRPRANRKSKKNTKPSDPPVKLDTLRSCLKGLSQDSGVGSSQECPVLNLDRIVVPDVHLKPGTSELPATSSSGESMSSTSSQETKTGSFSSVDSGIGRKRQLSESSLSDFEIKRPKLEPEPLSQTSDLGSDCLEKDSPDEKTVTSTTIGNVSIANEKSSKPVEKENSELCMFCNSAPKDSIFLHTNIAHQCCCYKCAKRTLHTIKRCPICNRSVNKVVKIYTS